MGKGLATQAQEPAFRSSVLTEKWVPLLMSISLVLGKQILGLTGQPTYVKQQDSGLVTDHVSKNKVVSHRRKTVNVDLLPPSTGAYTRGYTHVDKS